MTRAERNEYNEIRRIFKDRKPGCGAVLTIRTDAGSQFKHALHDFYTGLGFYPAAVKTDPQRFDEKERILYIERTEGIRWTELYSKAEKDLFADRLN